MLPESATNIGIHFFDMLTWVFGDVLENTIEQHETTIAAGFLSLQKANVKWMLSTDYQNILMIF